MRCDVSQIVEGVWRIGLGTVNAYLVEDDKGLVLVDTGPPGSMQTIGIAAATAGLRLRDVHTILLTHRHADHAGSLYELKRSTGALAVLHRLEAGDCGTGRRRGPLAALFGRARNDAQPASASLVDLTAAADLLLTGDRVPGLPWFRALHTPGHCAGHTAYLLDRAGGVLFAGDSAREQHDTVRLPAEYSSNDLAMAELSLRQLSTLDFEVACFGHGEPVRRGARQAFVDCLAELAVR
jgi:glyoxylase-like metal-dependent hydrolase (beta-lactamase superfamily II)